MILIKCDEAKKDFANIPTAGVYNEDCSKTSGARYLLQAEPVVRKWQDLYHLIPHTFMHNAKAVSKRNHLPTCGHIFSVRRHRCNFSSQPKVSNFQDIVGHQQILFRNRTKLVYKTFKERKPFQLLLYKVLKHTRFQVSMEITVFMHVCEPLQHLRHKTSYFSFRKRSFPFFHYMVQIMILVKSLSKIK